MIWILICSGFENGKDPMVIEFECWCHIEYPFLNKMFNLEVVDV